MIIPVLINVAFITLLERKILGLSQLRKGPVKVGILGLTQPFNDAIKLFTKEIIFPNPSNINIFILSPLCALVIRILAYLVFPFKEHTLSIGFRIIIVYTIIRINVYPVLISGWASNRKYALIGALRAVAQTISYEVRLALILIFYLRLRGNLNLYETMQINRLWSKWLLFTPLLGVWIVSCLAETNRTPFDFAEGESELVSGFNVEYGGLGFAIIFIAEYANILFLRIFTASFFFCADPLSISFYVCITCIVRIWIWIRTTFPRYRYDKLIELAWKTYLPITLIILILGIIIRTC